LIVVDSSAIVAIALEEAEADVFFDLLGAVPCIIAAPTLLETHMVLAKYSQRLGADFLTELAADKDVRIEPFDADLSLIARAAFDRYGKGRHPAKLNFGDCISYALAKARNLPLLFKGDDFPLTDIRPARRA
jgi:ribonuclease VapC